MAPETKKKSSDSQLHCSPNPIFLFFFAPYLTREVTLRELRFRQKRHNGPFFQHALARLDSADSAYQRGSCPHDVASLIDDALVLR